MDNLTPRQREVFDLRARGHTAREIGEILNITESTVKAHIYNARKAAELTPICHTVRTLMRLLRKYDPDAPVLIDAYAHQYTGLFEGERIVRRISHTTTTPVGVHICAADFDSPTGPHYDE